MTTSSPSGIILLFVIAIACVASVLGSKDKSSEMECTIDSLTGMETCRAVKNSDSGKSKLVLTPENIPLECGGLAVLGAGKDGEECLDYADTCRISVMDDPDGCDDEDDDLYKCCKVSCSICTKTEPAKKRGSIGVIYLNNGSTSERQGVDLVVREMTRYLREEVLVDDSYKLMYKDCNNKHELCPFWASIGECYNNKHYMQENCNLACKFCNQHSKYIHTMNVGGGF
uniref:ShKT domain-containing protein n=1 Tax=Ditylum brightwellii TaxID=49249 RepID=A0A6U3RCL5_9STRA